MSDYLEQRLEPEIQWYDQKSIANKRLFYIFRIATIVISACLIFMGYFSALSGWLVGLIGILIISIEALDGVLKPQEKWINYRATTESLRHEREMFKSKAGVYAGTNGDQLLTERCESQISREHSTWLIQAKQKKGE